MNKFTRGLVAGLLLAGMVGVTGCTTDNESEAAKAKPLGDPGKVEDQGKRMPAPSSQAEWKKQLDNSYQGKGYPGADKQKAN